MTYPQYPQQPSQQQPVAVPYADTLEVSDAAGLTDGLYQLQLNRVETYQGTRYQSNEMQGKLRFVFLVLSGPEQGKEAWNIENLPDPGKKLGPKAGLRKFLELLRGKPLVDGEQIQPASFAGTQGWAQIAGGKFQSFVPMDITQDLQPPARPPVAPPPQVQPQVTQPPTVLVQPPPGATAPVHAIQQQSVQPQPPQVAAVPQSIQAAQGNGQPNQQQVAQPHHQAIP